MSRKFIDRNKQFLRKLTVAFLLFANGLFLIWACTSTKNSTTNTNNSSSATPITSQVSPSPTLSLIAQHPEPVITVRTPGAEGIRFGFEGGTVVKVGQTYHLFTSEMMDNPMWVKMRLGHWTSTDRLHWKRVQTIRESSGDYTGTDARAALWSPMMVWDGDDNRWNLFYVAYHSSPNGDNQIRLNAKGRIWRAVAQKPGKEGITGPFEDKGIIMQPDAETEPWEGLQGVDSFYPWKVGNTWYAFYGSCKTEQIPIKHWLVGFAVSGTPSLAGPWKRIPSKNPAPIEKVFIENPVVSALPQGGYLCVYDSQDAETIGWAYSPDGVQWQSGNLLPIQPTPGTWAKDVRTAMGLVDEGNGRYTLFYTGFEEKPDWDRLLTGVGKEPCAIGFVELELKH
jgi:hypothetical protein